MAQVMGASLKTEKRRSRKTSMTFPGDHFKKLKVII
jgi:hypothetical protein